MKNYKKLGIVLIVILTFILRSRDIKAEDNNYIIYNNIKYNINAGSRTVSVCGYSGDESEVEIPSMIYHDSAKGFIVSEIKDHAFDGCSTIRVLTIPDTIMKVGDMSFIGMDNLQAVISKTEGINIVVKENVKIVSDRSELGNVDMDSDNSSGNTSNGDSGNGSSSGGGSGNNTIEDVKAVDSDGIIIDSNIGIITDASNGNIQNESNVDSSSSDNTTNDISGSNGIISGSDKKNNNTSKKTDSDKSESAAVNGEKSSATKVVVSIICVVLVAGLATGLFIYMKKKKR